MHNHYSVAGLDKGVSTILFFREKLEVGRHIIAMQTRNEYIASTTFLACAWPNKMVSVANRPRRSSVASGLRFLPYLAALCRPKWLIFFRCSVAAGTLDSTVDGQFPILWRPHRRNSSYRFLTEDLALDSDGSEARDTRCYRSRYNDLLLPTLCQWVSHARCNYFSSKVCRRRSHNHNFCVERVRLQERTLDVVRSAATIRYHCSIGSHSRSLSCNHRVPKNDAS